MDFSVRETVPADKGKTDDQLDDRVPGLSRIYTAVDMLVYLTQGWSYANLYGPLTDTLEFFVGRLSAGFPPHVQEHLARHLPANAIDQVGQTLGAMLTKAHALDASLAAGNPPADFVAANPANPNRIELRTLYENKFPDREQPVGAIVKDWVTIQNLLPGYIFLEWVDVQEKEAEPIVTQGDMQAFITLAKDYAPADAYLRSGVDHPDLVAALRDGVAKGIIKRPIPADLTVLQKNGTNDAKCINGICQTGHPGSWCNGTAGGACSAISSS